MISQPLAQTLEEIRDKVRRLNTVFATLSRIEEPTEADGIMVLITARTLAFEIHQAQPSAMPDDDLDT